MFNEFYDLLLKFARNEELREMITRFRSWELLAFPDMKLHPRLMGSFTWIGNHAEFLGETQVSDLAREMRDEITHYCVPWEQLDEYLEKMPVLVVGNLERAQPAQNRQSGLYPISGG